MILDQLRDRAVGQRRKTGFVVRCSKFESWSLFTSWVTVDKMLHLCEHQFPCL